MKKKIKKVPAKATKGTKIKKRQKPFNFQEGKIDKGSIFVVVFIIALVFGSYILTGGVTPTQHPPTKSSGLVNVVVPSGEPSKASLQMYTFSGVTVTPYPTHAGPQNPACSIPLKVVDCGHTLASSESASIVWSVYLSATKASKNQLALQLIYDSVRPMPLGSGTVSSMTKQPADHVTNPNVGNINNKDPNKFPFSPAVFLTDITANASDTSGDAQSGGAPQNPTDVYGAWKSAEGPDPKSANGLNLTTDGDAWPAANIPAGTSGHDLTWTAEVLWNIANLKTNTGQALKVGDTYRVQFTVHNGDETKDAAQVCATFTLTTDKCADPSQALSPKPS